MPMGRLLAKKGSFKVSQEDPSWKVVYLGNIQSSMMKGSGCVDRPVEIIWKNYSQDPNKGVSMQLNLCSSGMNVSTKDHPQVKYYAHRITYFTAELKYPRLFVWVYKHEGKKMKVELRCHVALCKSADLPMTIASLLKMRIDSALREFVREKTRQQNIRLALQRVNSYHSGMPLRRKSLSTAKNFRTPSEASTSAPKLGTIGEGQEEEQEDVLAGSLTRETYSRVLDSSLPRNGFQRSHSLTLASDTASSLWSSEAAAADYLAQSLSHRPRRSLNGNGFIPHADGPRLLEASGPEDICEEVEFSLHADESDSLAPEQLCVTPADDSDETVHEKFTPLPDSPSNHSKHEHSSSKTKNQNH